MTNTQLLIGSLSNDLFRVANCRVNGSIESAQRFAIEAKRWAKSLKDQDVEKYIKKIALSVASYEDKEVSLHLAENYLVYGILLQNHALQNLKSS